ncbi:hypothetical protein I4U23_030604 [Adineta vaga]|nr:hypothetical protein I4U23_030604 [Adineta vaga]
MSTDRQEIIDAFIERQRENFHQLIQNLSISYHNFRSRFSFPTDKSQQRYLFLSILLSFILLTIVYLIIVEYHRLIKFVRYYIRTAYSYIHLLFTRIRYKFLQKTTPSLFNLLLNRKSYIREKFSKEFVRALNQELFNRKERLSVETLQFVNAKIRNVSQNNNNNRSVETTAEKIIINAVLDIDHLILNIVNTFKEQHFSLETQKLSGQLYILLVINPNQYSIEANLQQLQIQPVNIIDSNHVLTETDKQKIVKLLDETITRTIVRCTFRLSDNQENINSTNLLNSSTTSHSETTKTSIPLTPFSTSSIQTNTSRFPQSNPPKYHLTESIPTVLINDAHQHLYTNQTTINKEPKKLLLRIVKAMNLHDVEQPFCVLELNHPKQIQQTNIANNGLNPSWDERFLFECNDQSNQIRLQIIDRKQSNKRTGNNYIDTVYADVLIPFSYVTTTVYKQDIQINPQHPESIIRIEVNTYNK